MDSETKCNLIVMLENDYHFFNVKTDLETYPPDMIQRVKDKLIEIVESEPFKFKTFILNLILAHEYTFTEKYAQAFHVLDDLEEEIISLENNNCSMSIFKKVSSAIRMVLKTCKAYVFLLQNRDKKAKDIVKKITSIENLDTRNKAAVYGIRSMVYMEYGLYGHKMALENAEKANKLDPKNPYWFFLIGKALGRIRRVEKPFDIPSDEERNALKTAIDMEENYLFMLFMAETYVETSTRTFRFHNRHRSLYPSLKLSIDQMNEKASNLYKKCIEKEPNCSHVLFRAARGFLNLPHPQRDIEIAKELLIKGLQSNPRNAFANHLLAKYYERFDSKIPEAIECLKICAEQHVFGAEMDLLRLKYTQDGVRSNPLERLQELLNEYIEAPRRIQILAQTASFYIFVDSDLPKACQLIKDAITLNCDDNILNHRSIFLHVRQPFSILDVLVDEMKMEMERKCSEEKKRIYESFIFYLNDSNVRILKGRAKNLKQLIIDEDNETRLGNYYRRPTNGNGPLHMRRRSLAKPMSRSTSEPHIERARSVQQVNEFFDPWIDDAKREEHRRNGYAKPNYLTNSLNKSYSDLPSATDNRFSRSNGRFDRNHNRFSRQENEFDRLSNSSPSQDQPGYARNKQYENGNFRPSPKKDDVAEEFDRLSVSSNLSSVSKPRGRGRSSYSASRPFQDRGDFDGVPRGRGRARQSDSNDNRASFNDSAPSFPVGRGLGPRRSYDRSNHEEASSKQGQLGPRRSYDRSNYEDTDPKQGQFGPRKSNDRSNYEESNSKQRQATFAAGTYRNERNENSTHKSNHDESTFNGSRENSTSFANWRRENTNKSSEEMKNQQRSKVEEKRTYSDIVTKPKPIQTNDNDDSDSDEDIMSYFKKK